ncbi:MAG: hypothetical protein LUC93_18310 [Planctomycetaceae bacterium]|nr:hypothetical protein [Planctomycetaceae bacterium]
MQIIALAGASGSGKSTVADILHGVLLDQGYSSLRESFARPIKQAAREMVGGGWVDNDELRAWMQNYGTKMRAFGEDYWIRQLANRCGIFSDPAETAPADFLVISDVRFPNEARFCATFGVVWLVDGNHRPLAGDVAGHDSESHISELEQYVTHVISNRAGIEDLAAMVKDFVRSGLHQKQENDHDRTT